MTGEDRRTRSPGAAGRSPDSAPTARAQRLEMTLGILGFFVVISLVYAVVAEVRGQDALKEVGVLILFLVVFSLVWRAWRRA